MLLTYGDGCFSTTDEASFVTAGHAFVAGREGAFTVISERGGEAILFLPARDRLATLAAERYGVERDFWRVNAKLDSGVSGSDLNRTLSFALAQTRAGISTAAGQAVESVVGYAFVEATSTCFGPSAWADQRTLVPRYVKIAQRMIRDAPEGELRIDDIADEAHVSVRTLRRGFADFLGVSLKRYLTYSRLDHVKARLVSGAEARPLQQIARAIGYKTYGAFSSAYRERHGETPSETRSHAFTFPRGAGCGENNNLVSPQNTRREKAAA